MPVSRRDFLRIAGLSALGASLSVPIRWVGARPAYAASLSPAVHVLNRVTFGPRPEDLALIEQVGIPGYIEWQLAPDAIPDPLVDEFTQQRPLLSMPYQQLAVEAQKDGWAVESALIWARMFRAAFSERQLYEVMVEFWTDHFNVPFGDYTIEKAIDDREVIRKHALGKFRDLLFASAQSPAMLQYLNQDSSEKEHPNENYARELMELHTLGVDGGYTERDVKEVARALTGWTVREGAPNRFYFDRGMHDESEKTVLGQRLAAGRGLEDGLDVLDMLTRHPATAQFISHKLCRRFVSDVPPQSLVKSTAAVFAATDGDIREMLRHILGSQEFMAAQGQKFRRPIEFMAAALRVARPTIDNEALWIPIHFLHSMGQLPYYWLPPNGYPDVAGAWLNTNGLLSRWNFGLAFSVIAGGWVEGARVDFDALIPFDAATAAELVDRAVARVFPGGSIAPADRDQLIAFASDGGGADAAVNDDLRASKLPTLIGLLIASPYFQWR